MSLLDNSLTDLLHIDDVSGNRLLDLGTGRDTFYLSKEGESIAAYMLALIKARFGKPGNTLLRGSAPGREEMIGRGVNSLDWADGYGLRDGGALSSLAERVYREIAFKGGNPLFLGLGALEWRVPSGSGSRDIRTPLIIFPALLVRGGANSPISLEFPDDDVYVNPCLLAKLRDMRYDAVADGFPLPASLADADDPVDINALDPAYFAAVKKYADECRGSEDSLFRFLPDVAALSCYDHGDVCMYRDIRARREMLETDEKVRRVFFRSDGYPPERVPDRDLRLPLERDSVQAEIIGRIAAGESLVIKGPPGSGKTQTIAGIVSALMGKGKRVLLASKKLSALGEVYAKLPEPLRAFALLLESETEEQAANIRPEAVAKDLKKLVSDRRAYRAPGEEVYGKRRRGMSAMGEASDIIENYRRIMFAPGSVAGLSYYDAINVSCRLATEPVPFVSPEEAAATDAETYESMYAAAEEGERLLAALSDGAPASYSPWMGADEKTDTEGARAALGDMAEKAGKLLAVLASYPGAEKLTAEGLHAVLAACAGEDDARRLASLPADTVKRLGAALDACTGVPDTPFAAFDGMEEALARLREAEKASEGLTIAELESISRNAEIFDGANGVIGRALLSNIEGVLDETDDLVASANVHYYNAGAVLRRRADMTDEDIKLVLSSRSALVRYESADRDKPGAFDFAAKRAVKELQKLCIVKAPLRALALAVKEFSEADGQMRAAAALRERLASIMRRRLTEEQEKCVSVMAHKVKREPGELLAALPGLLGAVRDCAVAGADGSLTLRELADRFETGMRYASLCREAEEAGLNGDPLAAASAAAALSGADESTAEAVALLCGSDGAEEAKELCASVAKAAADFGEKYFRNALSSGAPAAALRVLVKQWNDRSVCDAAVRFGRLCARRQMAKFFAPFARGERRSDDLAAEFEHSFFSAAVKGRAESLGGMRNGMGAAAEDALSRFLDGEREVSEADVSLIRASCMSSIDPDAKELAFLGSAKGGARTLRKLLKDHAKAVLALKRCFILSPSTVSLLLRGDEYFDFDTAIVDEASQLEPAALIPVLLRCRSVVLVGDEWQMPPIRDFRAAPGAPSWEDDELTADASALSVALANEAFRVCELVCHYRSKTESLIAFSRHRFYPFMRTFPAAVPTERDRLGFTDVYVDNGVCDDGVNIEEAVAVVRCIRKHFEMYYDEKTGVLSRSFGVVAFGTPQIKYITELVESDGELKKKKEKALANFRDVPEKLMFFKTIRTVQGQETDDLILSLTYGRRENGTLWKSFGTLNRGDLGECVFNVAVTRAKYSVTVVHSVRGAELTESSVAYIGEYLRMAERFAAGGRDGFVGNDPGAGFVRSVGEFIKSLGIAEERIVYDYGVTDGSVRVPVAVLSSDMSRAALGVWCERDQAALGYEYYDGAARYPDMLRRRGWTLHAVSAHDWTDNADAERRALAEAVRTALGTDI